MPTPMSEGHEQVGSLYDRDLYSWAIKQAALLREGRLSELDLTHIAEELDDVGSEQYEKLESALTILLMHMLKWDFQPAHRSRSWEGSIREHQRRIERVLRKNPGLKPRITEALQEAYPDACDRASAETDMPISAFPSVCHYNWDAITKRVFSVDIESPADTIAAHQEPGDR